MGTEYQTRVVRDGPGWVASLVDGRGRTIDDCGWKTPGLCCHLKPVWLAYSVAGVSRSKVGPDAAVTALRRKVARVGREFAREDRLAAVRAAKLARVEQAVVGLAILRVEQAATGSIYVHVTDGVVLRIADHESPCLGRAEDCSIESLRVVVIKGLATL